MNLSETGTDSQKQRTNYGCQGGEVQESNESEFGDQQMQTIIYRMDKQQGPTVQHREFYSIACDKQ